MTIETLLKARDLDYKIRDVESLIKTIEANPTGGKVIELVIGEAMNLFGHEGLTDKLREVMTEFKTYLEGQKSEMEKQLEAL